MPDNISYEFFYFWHEDKGAAFITYEIEGAWYWWPVQEGEFPELPTRVKGFGPYPTEEEARAAI